MFQHVQEYVEDVGSLDDWACLQERIEQELESPLADIVHINVGVQQMGDVHSHSEYKEPKVCLIA